MKRGELPAGQVRIERLRFSGHSLGRGAAIWADRADVGLVRLTTAGGCKDACGTARFIDEPDAFEDTAAASVMGG